MQAACLCLLIALGSADPLFLRKNHDWPPSGASPGDPGGQKPSIALIAGELSPGAGSTPASGSAALMPGLASWYGEEHRGKLMANGRRFNPDRPTAASWFYALGTRVRVTLQSSPPRCVVVTITDRGPAWRLVHQGRVIDLARGAFEQIAPPKVGLVRVKVEPLEPVP